MSVKRTRKKISNMINVSEIKTEVPKAFKNQVQAEAYKALEALNIPFQRVDTDEVITMEDCVAVDAKLKMKMVKTLFLCDRQQENYYLFVTCGNKRFNSSSFSQAMNSSRVSFASKEMMGPMLGTVIGACTVFSTLIDKAGKFQVVIDRDVLKEEYYGCSDGTTTGYMKIKTDLVIDKLLPYAQHEPKIIDVI